MKRLRRICRLASVPTVLYAGSIVVRHEISAHFHPLEIVLTAVVFVVFAIEAGSE